MKQIDETAGRMGIAMRLARHRCYLPHDQVATLLRITPNELAEYEHAQKKITSDILERVFTMAYKMMHLRILESMYRRQRNMFNKFNQPK